MVWQTQTKQYKIIDLADDTYDRERTKTMKNSRHFSFKNILPNVKNT